MAEPKHAPGGFSGFAITAVLLNVMLGSWALLSGPHIPAGGCGMGDDPSCPPGAQSGVDVYAVLTLWLIVDVVLALVWLVRRIDRR